MVSSFRIERSKVVIRAILVLFQAEVSLCSPGNLPTSASKCGDYRHMPPHHTPAQVVLTTLSKDSIRFPSQKKQKQACYWLALYSCVEIMSSGLRSLSGRWAWCAQSLSFIPSVEKVKHHIFILTSNYHYSWYMVHFELCRK